MYLSAGFKPQSMKKRFFLPLVLSVMVFGISSCKKELIPGTYESKRAAMGNGEVWSWVNFDQDGNPVAMGLSMTEPALENLPDSVNHPSGNDHANIIELQLPPTLVSKTPFLHSAINWNPKGHIPIPVYDKPHFDVHFYMITSDERKAIPEYEADSMKYKNFPPPEYLPADYINPGKGEPEMGAHWVDLKSPELNGDPFKETFVYGSWDGKVTFYEPMLTYTFLKNIDDYTRAIPWPSKVKISGYYPKTMRVKHRDGLYTICLEDLEFRKAD